MHVVKGWRTWLLWLAVPANDQHFFSVKKRRPSTGEENKTCEIFGKLHRVAARSPPRNAIASPKDPRASSFTQSKRWTN